MTRIALIQDGTEVARQSYADVAACFQKATEQLARQRPPVSIDVYTDETTAYFLEGLTPEHYRCVVLASNALLSTSVSTALEAGAQNLHDYVLQGGGLVVLHQLVDEVGWVLPFDLALRQHDRQTAADCVLTPEDPDDVLLWFPNEIDCSRLCDGGHDEGPRRLYWRALLPADTEARLKPVLTGVSGDLVLARSPTRSPENVVVCTMPADWHKRTDLLANVLAYGVQGKPDRVVWRTSEEERDEPLEAQLSATGTCAFGTAPQPSNALTGTQAWLLRQMRYCIVPSGSELARLRSSDDGRAFVESGGTLLAIERVSATSTSIEGVLGGAYERLAVPELYAELHAVKGWQTADYAFELRNIVALLRTAWNAHRTNRLAIDPASLEAMIGDVRDRLADPVHRADYGSSIALAQALAYMGIHGGDLRRAAGWLSEEAARWPLDVQAQVCALETRFDRSEDADVRFIAIAHEALSAPQCSPAALARVADAIAFAASFGLVSGADLTGLATALITRLDDQPPHGEVGWLSAEATADIGRALVVLKPSATEPSQQRALDRHLVGIQTMLRAALARYQRNPKGVAWRCRLIDCLVLIDRATPPGLERLAPLTQRLGPADARAEASAEGLTRHLTDVTLELRDEVTRLSRDVWPARLGRAVANLAAVVVIVMVGLEVGTRLAGRSIGEALGAIGAALGALFLLTVVLASVLNAGDLLYSWARRPYERARNRLLRSVFARD